MATTCQICGREIKAAKGLIAHHGYRRPGEGWQTASCLGARYRPLEIACDAIEHAIGILERQILSLKLSSQKWLENPPEKIERLKYAGKPRYGFNTYLRPDGFDPADRPISYGARPGDYYRLHYFDRLDKYPREIRDTKGFLAELRSRLESWAPTA